MSHRDEVLGRVRDALKVKAGRPIPPPPPVRFNIPEMGVEERAASFKERLEALNGCGHIVASREEAAAAVQQILNGRSAAVSPAPFLKECGIAGPPLTRESIRAACAEAGVGITSAAYALAATGTLVLLAGADEQRLISLLPPVHIAVIPASRILVNLDELFTLIPRPADQTSALIFITGPSRTGDIEQILVRGVHGPGEVHVVIVNGV
jgi:L-lactate dehydrogenase complex protein LldG